MALSNSCVSLSILIFGILISILNFNLTDSSELSVNNNVLGNIQRILKDHSKKDDPCDDDKLDKLTVKEKLEKLKDKAGKDCKDVKEKDIKEKDVKEKHVKNHKEKDNKDCLKFKSSKKDKKDKHDDCDCDCDEDDDEDAEISNTECGKDKKVKHTKEKHGKDCKKHAKNSNDCLEYQTESTIIVPMNDSAITIEPNGIETISTEGLFRQLLVTNTNTEPFTDLYPAQIPYLSNLTDAMTHQLGFFMNTSSQLDDYFFDHITPKLVNETAFNNYMDIFQNFTDSFDEIKHVGLNNTMNLMNQLTDQLNSLHSSFIPYGNQKSIAKQLNNTKNALSAMKNELSQTLNLYMGDMNTTFTDFWSNFTEYANNKQNLLSQGKQAAWNTKQDFINSITANTNGKWGVHTTQPTEQVARFANDNMNTFLNEFKKVLNDTLYSFLNTTNHLNKFPPHTSTTTTTTTVDTSLPSSSVRYSYNPNENFFAKFDWADFINKQAIPPQLRSTQSVPTMHARSTDTQSTLLSLFEQAKPHFAQYFEDFKNSEKGSQIMKQFNSSDFSTFVDDLMNNKANFSSETTNLFKTFKNQFTSILGNLFDTHPVTSTSA